MQKLQGGTDVSTEDKVPEPEWHRTFATSLFNLTWDLLDEEERTREENDTMIHAAHASRYHWGQIGTPLEFERGEWQISRVYAVLGRPEAAIHHAQRCLDICRENDFADFDIAFAYEGLARAYAVAGNAGTSREYIELASQAALRIEEDGNREYFLSELQTVTDLLV
jgi:tetratricopeptide (TPR) repeat protein